MGIGSNQNFLKDSTYWPFSLLEGGVPRGVLVEVSSPIGGGKTEVILKFLAENQHLRVAWVEKDFTVYPCAFLQQKVKLDRVLFVDTPQYLWAAHQVLKSQIFEVVVLSASIPTEIQLRRLQIEAKKSGTTVILLTDCLTEVGTWPVAMQVDVMRRRGMTMPQMIIRKRKGSSQKVYPLLSEF